MYKDIFNSWLIWSQIRDISNLRLGLIVRDPGWDVNSKMQFLHNPDTYLYRPITINLFPFFIAWIVHLFEIFYAF